MTTWLLTAIGGVILSCATPFAQTWLSRYINRMRKVRSLARIKQEPCYAEGRCIEHAIDPASGVVVCENYYIAKLDVGRVLLVSLDQSVYLPMSCMEFESLHVVIASDAEYDIAGHELKPRQPEY